VLNHNTVYQVANDLCTFQGGVSCDALLCDDRYVWSGLVVLVGVALNVYSKNYESINNWLKNKLYYSTNKLSSSMKQVV